MTTSACAAVALALGGCQTYAPKPLEPGARYAAFLERTASVPDVSAAALREGVRAEAFDPSDGLTLEEAEAIALVFNPELRLARLRAGVARAEADHAGLWEDPVLGADFARIIQSVPDRWMAMGSLGFTLPVSGRLEVEQRRAGAAYAAALARAAEQEWASVNELRGAWMRWSAALREREVLAELVAQVESLVGIIDAMESAGEIARLESALFRIELATRRAQLEKSENAVREMRQRVLRAMGLPAGADAELIPSLEIDSVGAEALAIALERNPGLAVTLAEYEVAERRLELEIRRQYPDIGLMPGGGTEMGNERITLGVAVPLPLWNRNQQGIAVAMAEREAAAGAYDAAAESLHAEIEAALLRLESARIDRVALEERIVPLVDQQFIDARAVAELGEVNVLLLLETLTRRQEARLSLIDAILAEATAMVELMALIGPEPVVERTEEVIP